MNVPFTGIRFCFWTFALFSCCTCTAQFTLFAQNLPTGFRNVNVQEGYTSPMGMVFIHNGQTLFFGKRPAGYGLRFGMRATLIN